MRTRTGMRRAAVAGAAVLALLAGCGSDSGPRDAVPELGAHLDAVDAAIVDAEWDTARSELEALVARAEQAAEAGDISSEEADRIRAAASRLLERLPEEEPEQTETEPEVEEPEQPEAPPEEPEETEDEPEETEDEPEEEPEETDEGPGRGEGEGQDDAPGQEDNPGQGNNDGGNDDDGGGGDDDNRGNSGNGGGNGGDNGNGGGDSDADSTEGGGR